MLKSAEVEAFLMYFVCIQWICWQTSLWLSVLMIWFGQESQTAPCRVIQGHSVFCCHVLLQQSDEAPHASCQSESYIIDSLSLSLFFIPIIMLLKADRMFHSWPMWSAGNQTKSSCTEQPLLTNAHKHCVIHGPTDLSCKDALLLSVSAQDLWSVLMSEIYFIFASCSFSWSLSVWLYSRGLKISKISWNTCPLLHPPTISLSLMRLNLLL